MGVNVYTASHPSALRAWGKAARSCLSAHGWTSWSSHLWQLSRQHSPLCAWGPTEAHRDGAEPDGLFEHPQPLSSSRGKAPCTSSSAGQELCSCAGIEAAPCKCLETKTKSPSAEEPQGKLLCSAGDASKQPQISTTVISPPLELELHLTLASMKAAEPVPPPCPAPNLSLHCSPVLTMQPD